MKKFILTIGFCISLPSLALAEEIINDDMQQAFNQTQQEINQSVQQMDAVMQEVVPELAQGMSETVNNIFNSFPPLLEAMERNQVFSKTGAKMQQDIQASLRRIENGIGTPSSTDSSTLSNTSAASAPKAEIKESFLLTGSRNENGKSLDFIISQNAEQIQETKTLIDYKTSPEKSDKNIQLSDFYQQNLPLENFVLENIIGQNFLVYNNETYGTFIIGNYNNKINIKLQTAGIDSYARAQSFIRNLEQNYLK